MPCGWAVKADMVCVCGWQVKLCDPLVTHGPYLSALEIRVGIIKCYGNGLFTLLYLLLPFRRTLWNCTFGKKFRNFITGMTEQHKLRY